ncbi:MAG: IS982 family transposase [Bacteroidetes bacterium]|nr:IS982 family transposase [Bacteroidota bacterium]
MNWQDQLINIYLIVCQEYENHLWKYCERFTNNSSPKFTDQEVITIYIFGIMEHLRTVKDIHRFAINHLRTWFPNLTEYEAFNARLSFLCSVLEHMIPILEKKLSHESVIDNARLTDSMPIILAKNTRASNARVAREICTKGYCSSKNLYYYGLKLHAIVLKRHEQMPRIEYVSFTPASEHDVIEFRSRVAEYSHSDFYGDKAYVYHGLEDVVSSNGIQIYTPIQRKRNDPPLNEMQILWNSSISRMRQPIESLFNWLQEKTGIQNASKVRSTKGLLVHLFGRLIAAPCMLIFNP